MKCALLVDHDAASRHHTAAMLRSLGYLVAPTDNTQAALHAAQTVRIDVVLTDTACNAEDRRSFVGELGRLAPGAPMILVIDGAASVPQHDGYSAMLHKPVTPRGLRRVLEFGIDGYGTLPTQAAWSGERRRMPDRRHRPR